MGALDEAIREHLELKRKHGAGEEELREKEQEALGAARREAPEAQEEAGPAKPAASEDPVAEPEPPPVASEHPVAEPEPPPAEPEPPRAEPEVHRSGDTPPRGVEAAEAPPAEEPPADGEDVLEETPEFLQETPEHDRLWFEQKPPRDFDFDE